MEYCSPELAQALASFAPAAALGLGVRLAGEERARRREAMLAARDRFTSGSGSRHGQTALCWMRHRHQPRPEPRPEPERVVARAPESVGLEHCTPELVHVIASFCPAAALGLGVRLTAEERARRREAMLAARDRCIGRYFQELRDASQRSEAWSGLRASAPRRLERRYARPLDGRLTLEGDEADAEAIEEVPASGTATEPSFPPIAQGRFGFDAAEDKDPALSPDSSAAFTDYVRLWHSKLSKPQDEEELTPASERPPAAGSPRAHRVRDGVVDAHGNREALGSDAGYASRGSAVSLRKRRGLGMTRGSASKEPALDSVDEPLQSAAAAAACAPAAALGPCGAARGFNQAGAPAPAAPPSPTWSPGRGFSHTQKGLRALAPPSEQECAHPSSGADGGADASSSTEAPSHRGHRPRRPREVEPLRACAARVSSSDAASPSGSVDFEGRTTAHAVSLCGSLKRRSQTVHIGTKGASLASPQAAFLDATARSLPPLRSSSSRRSESSQLGVDELTLAQASRKEDGMRSPDSVNANRGTALKHRVAGGDKGMDPLESESWRSHLARRWCTMHVERPALAVTGLLLPPVELPPLRYSRDRR